ncbi:MAG: Rrf2 family transcriptional regulator [Chloroflexi bacterium]|nr:Rrf2 family transcriptional regulator [Chloroflexota bacterium]
MKLSTRGQYGARLLLDLALHKAEGPVLLKDIARRQEIPLAYLKHLVAPLVGAGILRSARGAKGGLLLAKPPEQVKLREVIQLLEGPINPVECVNDPAVCGRSSSCATRDVWVDLQKAMEGVLEATTVANLVERHREKEQPVGAMYNI